MKPALLNSRAMQAWTFWGHPKEILIDRARPFHSGSPQNVLTESETGGAQELDPKP